MAYPVQLEMKSDERNDPGGSGAMGGWLIAMSKKPRFRLDGRMQGRSNPRLSLADENLNSMRLCLVPRERVADPVMTVVCYGWSIIHSRSTNDGMLATAICRGARWMPRAGRELDAFQLFITLADTPSRDATSLDHNGRYHLPFFARDNEHHYGAIRDDVPDPKYDVRYDKHASSVESRFPRAGTHGFGAARIDWLALGVSRWGKVELRRISPVDPGDVPVVAEDAAGVDRRCPARGFHILHNLETNLGCKEVTIILLAQQERILCLSTHVISSLPVAGVGMVSGLRAMMDCGIFHALIDWVVVRPLVVETLVGHSVGRSGKPFKECRASLRRVRQFVQSTKYPFGALRRNAGVDSGVNMQDTVN
ncbi:hypothetical protein An02g02100 [Aspergillus niger]|uniref:Uncharacterized protein n=2 Tax=Aspergillus niger TaxID=5061 RepID=A2QC31_ASPNC|nr:hypothetical protein An02g02100 [Aspergillus niger]CAK37512.1 hypothetical protein An02g02100 [Aspergillus niger]